MITKAPNRQAYLDARAETERLIAEQEALKAEIVSKHREQGRS